MTTLTFIGLCLFAWITAGFWIAPLVAHRFAERDK